METKHNMWLYLRWEGNTTIVQMAQISKNKGKTFIKLTYMNKALSKCLNGTQPVHTLTYTYKHTYYEFVFPFASHLYTTWIINRSEREKI